MNDDKEYQQEVLDSAVEPEDFIDGQAEETNDDSALRNRETTESGESQDEVQTTNKRRRKNHLTYQERMAQEQMMLKASLEEERQQRLHAQERLIALESALLEKDKTQIETSEAYIENEIERLKADLVGAKAQEDYIKEIEINESLEELRALKRQAAEYKQDLSYKAQTALRMPDNYYDTPQNVLRNQWIAASEWRVQPELKARSEMIENNLSERLLAMGRGDLIGTIDFYNEITNQTLGGVQQPYKGNHSKVAYSGDESYSAGNSKQSVSLTKEEFQNFKDIFADDRINGQPLSDAEIIKRGKQVKMERLKAEGSF